MAPGSSRLKVRNRGISFVEVLIGTAIVALLFTGIIGGFQLAVKMIAHVRAQSGALALANERIEYLRSLPYDDVGTQGGIPAGSVLQNETLSLNGVSYVRRTLVQYVDAPEDGQAASDTNGIIADYKRAKVELTWTIRDEAQSIALVTNLIPRGIETIAGGGTLTINVFDASAEPVSGAEVRVVNASTSPAIDVTVYTNASGSAMFPGAPASGGYQITATKAGYSTDQTYGASVANPNPNPPHVAVIESEVSTANFAIDWMSSLAVRTVLPPTLTHDDDPFADQSGIASSTDTVVAGGALVLATSSGLYAATGAAMTVSVAPNPLSWTEASWNAVVPAQASLKVSVYADDGGGTLTLIPDGDLPGNAAGFTTSPIDLSALSVASYPRLALRLTLESFDGLDTPSVEDRRISYMAADTPAPNIAFTLIGTKNIGTDGSGVPIRKYGVDHQTDGNGVWQDIALEWDFYDIAIDGAVEGYDIADACDAIPFALPADTVATTTLVLVPHTVRSALVRAETGAGEAIPGATVTVTRPGLNETTDTSTCGYAHFPSLTAASDYTVEVSAPGYMTETLSGVAVDGTERLDVTLADI